MSKSINAGVSWTYLVYGSSLSIDPINTATIYVASYGLYKSTDGGESFSSLSSGLPDDYVSSLAVAPVNPNVVYAGTYEHGVFKSADGGANWNPLNDGLANLNVNTLAIDASGNFLHAGTGAGVFDYQYIAAPPPTNPIDDAQFFVRQHYLDFLNREPDAGGLAYWTDRITQCGYDTRCIHDRRNGVSAAFFIELEFQETGYFVDRFYKASLSVPLLSQLIRSP